MLDFGLLKQKGEYDNDGGLIVAAGNRVESNLSWSKVANGHTVTEEGNYINIIDADSSTYASVVNTSTNNEGWALQGDLGKVYTINRVYMLFGLQIAVAGREGRVLIKTSVDGTTWTTVKTGTTVATGSAVDQYDALNVRFRYLRMEFDQLTVNTSQTAQAFIYNVVLFKGG